MERSERTRFNLVVTCLVVGVLASALYATPPSDRCILIKAQVTNKDEAEALVNMDLDIWEFQQDGFIVRVTDTERKQIEEGGFTVEIITGDVYEYLETISREQISLFAEPTPAKYHSHDEVIASLTALEDSGIARTYIIGNTHEGRDIWAVKISDYPSEDEGEPGALFLGCHHAREWISVEVPLYIAQYLTDNYYIDKDVKHLVDNCEIWIVPVVNPDGYECSRITDRLWRKNRRDNGDGTFGVDLNRNYGHMWGWAGSSGKTSAWNYRGPSAFSEPESQAVRDLVLAHDFRILMSYHSYGQQTLMPWGYTRNPCPDDFPMSTMSLKMRNLIQETSGATYRDWWDSGGYLVAGDTGDWSYGELGVYSFGIELPPRTSSEGGFVLPENKIMPTCVENLPAALYLISFAAANDGTEYLATGEIQSAINEASEGDEIVIEPGLYQENIIFIDKNLTLRSIDPNDPDVVAATVIEGVPQYPAITLSGGRDRVCVLAGLTITGGGVGICCRDVSPTIKNCTIESTGPNAIEFWEGSEPPAVIDCTILGQVVEVKTDTTFVAHWKLDETEGSTAYDSEGENNVSVFGGAVWQPTGGKIGGALQLDGVDDWLFTGRVKNLGAGSFSIVAWTKGGASNQAIVSQPMISNWLMANDEGRLTTGLGGSGQSQERLVSDSVITDGDWHRIALVLDESQRKLYVDGVMVAEDSQASSEISDSSLNIGVGKNYLPGTYWSGMIDDVRIYDVALSTEEIEALAQ